MDNKETVKVAIGAPAARVPPARGTIGLLLPGEAAARFRQGTWSTAGFRLPETNGMMIFLRRIMTPAPPETRDAAQDLRAGTWDMMPEVHIGIRSVPPIPPEGERDAAAVPRRQEMTGGAHNAGMPLDRLPAAGSRKINLPGFSRAGHSASYLSSWPPSSSFSWPSF